MYKLTDDNSLYCSGCHTTHRPEFFYKSYSPHFKLRDRQPFCKQYLSDYVKLDDGTYSKKRLIDMCRMMDSPFILSAWTEALNSSPDNAVMGYFSSLNLRYRDKTFLHSEFGNEVEESLADDTLSPSEVKRLQEKWEGEYTVNELLAFERKYKEYEPHYDTSVAHYKEYLRVFIILSYRANTAMVKGDEEQANKWRKMADDVAKGGNLQPNQLSKIDLQGGMNSVSDIVTAVEKEVDIIELLPEFTSESKDDVDKVILLIVNYLRRLHDLDLVDELDLYSFIGERIKEWKMEKDNKKDKSKVGVEDDNTEE